jgi:hypothetical protein
MKLQDRPDRRRPRRRCRIKVVTAQGLSFTLDVGDGGFCTESLRVLPPGTLVQGRMHVKGQEMPFAGRVAWAKAGYPHINLKGRMGVVFTSAPPALRSLVSGP